MENKPTLTEAQKRAGVILLVITVLLIISALPWIGAWTTVGAGHVGVVTRFSAVNRVVNPGFVLKLPLIEGV